ncbi:MAG: hypothetical protein A3A43_00055 [Candidatus Liptonbacteria bacterium RIFCSPLOWO2_01_FULL_56_20]|uniref:Fibronectin type-III domain-containing protein n=1 Tax=Candidatus Liptonbacteria bacterium RIFCSPLOWO2_01_FULL_56_20 TaxID=1798652 RepID=A0A1G2CKJ5_9BACT|nr:MAG: hypothetical protein A2681_02320 [Candidatus Liptonbacteria bacterium RIFCSPHIGHO2_01_FULL_56_18b]OGZ01777.1 MAG: hypothetical protein A3A43_00055 [Candidatus Liptonbacteria bacterium RIFCSPLOWO2_01_FULL_56_20]
MWRENEATQDAAIQPRAAHHLRPLHWALLAVSAGVLVAGFLFSNFSSAASSTFTQTSWDTQTSNATGHPPPANWTEYESKDSGISAGAAIFLSATVARTYKSGGKYSTGIFCLDVNTCWTADGALSGGISTRLIRKTTDGGSTWTFAETPVVSASETGFLNDVQFVDVNVGYASFSGSNANANTVFKSTDGGVTWSSTADFPSDNRTHGLFAINSSTVIAVRRNGVATSEIFRTTNGGTSWSDVGSGCDAPATGINDVHFPNSDYGYAVGQAGRVCKTTDGGATWAPATQTTSSIVAMNVVYFVSTSTGWVGGDSGLIYKTTDGGASWSLQTSNIINNITSLNCPSSDVCWIAGFNTGNIARTTNGGTDWTVLTPPLSLGPNYVFAVNASTAYAFFGSTGNSSGLYKTTNAGSNWSMVYPVSASTLPDSNSIAMVDASTLLFQNDPLIWRSTDSGATWTGMGTLSGVQEVFFVSSSTGWAATGNDDVYKTTDGGANWTIQMNDAGGSSSAGINSLHFTDSSTGWWTGADAGEFARTVNGGTTWTTSTVGTATWLDTFFISSSTGWLVGTGGAIKKSADGGAGWADQTSGTANDLYSVYCTDASNCFAAGAAGTIVKTANGGTSWSTATSGVTAPLYGVYFKDASLGFAVGASSTAIYSTSGGTSWTNLNVNFGGQAQAFTHVSGLSSTNSAYAAGESGVVVHLGFTYPSSQALISSAYDSTSSVNTIASVSWTEDTSLPSGTTVTISVRAASATSSLGSATWYDFTNATGGCSKNSGVVTCPTAAVPAALKDGSEDRWFQYKVTLTSTGANTPTVYDVSIGYVVNAAPGFNPGYGTNGVSVSQNSSSAVSISYSIRDPDTLSGTVNPGYITPSFEYDIGGGWVAIGSPYLGASDLGDKAVSEVSYAAYTATWNATSQIPGIYAPAAQIRILANDNEGANNTAYATSSAFILDTRQPTSTLLINVSGGSLNFTIQDDSDIEYRLSNNSDLSADGANGTSGAWQTVGATSTAASTTWNFTGTTSYVRLYAQARDAYGNTTSATAVAPAPASNMNIQDISNIGTSDFKEFISWNVYAATTSATFSKYEVHRSTGGAYSILTNILSSSTNYYLDPDVSSSTTYSYRVRIVDTDGDVADYSSVVSDRPDGQGGTDAAPPAISSVAVAETQATWARITWTTDEVSSSSVGHSVSPSVSFASSTEVASFVTSHSVVVGGLQPNTAYKYRVRSTDPFGNTATDDNGGAGYGFTTASGPVISGVTAINVADRSATIFWNTDTDSNSYVTYSINSSLSGSTQAGSGSMVGGPTSTLHQHRVNLTGLSPGTAYYYKVQSTDASDNTSIDTNNNSYYTFTTTRDLKAPVISNITTPVISSAQAVIVWQTDEPATTQAQYGTATGVYQNTTAKDNTLSAYHVVTLSSLSPSTAYYFLVKSDDEAGNEGVSSEQTFSTTATGQVTVVVAGGAPSPERDTTPPKISSVEATSTGAFNTTVTFTTSESSVAFVEYGGDTSYGSSAGSASYALNHGVRVGGLRVGTEYHFRVKALDNFGNAAFSPDQTVTTKFLAEAVPSLVTLENSEDIGKEIENVIESVLPSIVPPFISRPEATDVTENSATITWRTNVNAYSVVQYAGEDDYNTENANPYAVEVSDTANKVTDHRMRLIDLKPNTLYHFTVKSFSLPRAVSKSADLTFVTKAAKIQARVVEVKKDGFLVVWSTDEPTDSIVEYRNLITGEIDRKIDESKKAFHEVRIENLLPGTLYEVRVSGYNEKGNLIEAVSPIRVTTSRDVTPPVISSFKIETSLIPQRTDRAQAVVSWKTDEPATSIVYYEEGSGAAVPDKQLAQKAEITDNFVTNHVVLVSNLRPGSIYRVQVASADQAGNEAMLPVRATIIPRQAESVIDVIFKNFEETFRFLRNVGQ